MEKRIRYTQNSGILKNEAMGFEVDIDGKRLLDLYSDDDVKWEIMASGSQYGETITLSWNEFLEIVFEMQKFIARENETIIGILQKGDTDDDLEDN